MSAQWSGVAGPLAEHVRVQTEQCLAAYRAKPNLVEQDAGIEISNVEGGYGRKQLHELVQNAADALVGTRGQIALVLTDDTLYCANEGDPLTRNGIETLMASHLSRKRDEEIGRYGLGFKSVLGISDAPEIISRDVSIRFDRKTSESLIRKVVPNADRTPVLRTATAFDPTVAAVTDPVLAELMAWATTVVRLPLLEGSEWLPEALAKFPPEFLLFSEHVDRLDLDNVRDGERREWQAIRQGSRVVLESSDQVAVWNVYRATHQPSAAARKDAGEITGRGSIELTWAVPEKGRTKVGTFWSYFPTTSTTSLTGIINAPFKTNEDRHDILKGLYNDEILGVLPALVSANLADVVDTSDPGSVMDILPARGKEIRSWADAWINDRIMEAVAAAPCLPDMNGRMCLPGNVKWQPAFLSEYEPWLTRWASVSDRPRNWVHPSVWRTEARVATAARLVRLAGENSQSVGEWLHDLATAGLAGAQEAIRLASDIDRSASDHMVEMRKGAFVLTAGGKLVPPRPGTVFLPDTDTEKDNRFVHPAVVADLEVRKALEGLGIGRLDQKGRLRAQIDQMTKVEITGRLVESMWDLTRGLPVVEVGKLLETGFGRGRVPVRTTARRIEVLDDVLLPGVVVPEDGSRDAGVAVDTTFHAKDMALLRHLGALSEPELEHPRADEEWFQQWEEAARSEGIHKAKELGVKIPASRVKITRGVTVRGLDIADRLSDLGRSALTRHVLRMSTRPWSVEITGNSGVPPMSFTNPAVWWMIRHGRLETPLGVKPVGEAFASIPGVPDDVMPVAKVTPEQARALELRETITARDWKRILLAPWTHLHQDALNRLYSAAAKVGAPAPDEIGVTHARATLAAPSEAYVTDNPSDYEALVDSGYAAILATDTAAKDALIASWGLSDSQGIISRTILAAASGEPVLIADRFPGLRAFVPRIPAIELIPCSDVSVEVRAESTSGTKITDHDLLRDGDATLYHLDRLSEDGLLARLSHELNFGLTESDRKKVLDIGARGEAKKLRQQVRAEKDENRKLVLLAGVDALEKEIPAGAKALAERRTGRTMSDTEIAAMAKASKGAGLLTRIAPAIEENGIVLPRLAGGVQASAAVQDLGLPAEFAGSRTAAPPPRFQVIGPVGLPPLHNYQENVVANLMDVLGPEGLNRGIVSLPTGSGKTRVAVEAIIRHLKASESEPTVIWIAQSDELCEQAVDTWSYTWSAIGEPGARLTISRLWGSNDAIPAEDGAHLVVATDAKLLSLSRKSNHEWLTDAEIVLVDEAHTSISKTYTELFKWLKRGTNQRERTLIGLSASPYRGHNEDQTKGLINRYDSNLLTEGVFEKDPHEELQDMGILARVRHIELEGMTLTPAKVRKDPDAAAMHLDDYRIDLNEVAMDNDRNRAILDSLESLPADMTALVFTASVQHAELLAAVLAHSGVPAASIAGYTPAPERRRLVRRFRDGDIRVLTNYNVLSQGFDAPKVGAVYVTRPTFSPNRYQQMIGRGLRGPKNGGSEEVLIVNVRDNIDAFGTQLAFHHFDHLWNRK